MGVLEGEPPTVATWEEQAPMEALQGESLMAPTLWGDSPPLLQPRRWWPRSRTDGPRQ